MRLRAEYCMGPELRFLSNLDSMHLLERALRRAELPYALSSGFNPHIRLSMGTVLPVGLWGEREYFDLDLRETMPVPEFINRLNRVLPPAMTISQAREVGPYTPALMQMVNSAAYTLVLSTVDFPVREFFDRLLEEPSLPVKSRGKKKNLDKDLRSGIYRIDIDEGEAFLKVTVWVATGEPLNVRYDEVLDLLEARGLKKSGLRDVYRSGNYVHRSSRFYSPMEKVE